MKLFFKNGVYFFLLLTAISILLIFLIDWGASRSIDVEVPPNKIAVLLGHSHPECAVNDSLTDDLINLSQSGESYFYTYIKLRKILSSNSHIKTVLVEFTNNSIFPNKDSWIWGDKYLNHNYTKYAGVMDAGEKFFLLKKNPRGFLTVQPNVLKTEIGYIFRRSHFPLENWGGYFHLSGNKIDAVDSLDELPAGKFSESNLVFLRKIQELCKQNDVNFLLLRSPLHKKYYTGDSNKTYFTFLLKNDFMGIPFLDFKDFPLEDNDFGDLEHLNYKGAKKFSLAIDSLFDYGYCHKCPSFPDLKKRKPVP